MRRWRIRRRPASLAVALSLLVGLPAVAPAAERVTVVGIDLSDAALPAGALAAAHRTLLEGPRSVAAFFRAISDGRLRLTGGDLRGPFAVQGSAAGACDYQAWSDAAAAQAGPLGDDHVVFLQPEVAACDWLGLGDQPGRTLWINGSATTRALAHELGHNLGLSHTGLLRCERAGARTALTGTCRRDTVDGGDPWSLMGTGKLRRLVGYQAAQLGWLPAGRIATARRGGRFTIVPMESDAAGIKLLRVPRPGGRSLDLELHRPQGRWAPYRPGVPVVTGVTVREAPSSLRPDAPNDTALVDATPRTATYADAPLRPGRRLTAGGTTITVLAVDRRGGTVDVTFARTRRSIRRR